MTGVLVRSTGVKRDLRLCKNYSYSSYNHFFFKSFLGVNGDTYDRYLIRMLEMGESLTLVNKTIKKLLYKQNYKNTDLVIKDLFLKKSQTQYSSMEDLINHFIQ
ncbi:MAG: hypothetical protein KDH96_06765 [Candidatus Riesia sp.]|nr:hypothetical protein [Candidatus Riesia sp.]